MDLLPVLDALQATTSAARGFIHNGANGHAYDTWILAGSSLRQRIRQLLGGARQKPLEPDLLTAFEGWLQGLVLAERRLTALLDRERVRPIAAVGQPFDPHYHVAVAVRAEAGAADGTVVAEEVRGYVLDDRILRHAEVVVARSKHLAEGGGGDTNPWD